MQNYLYLISFVLLLNMSGITLKSQENNISTLSIEQIMQGSKFVGNLPDNIEWADNSKQFYFYWNPENAFSDSLYSYDIETGETQKVDFETEWELPSRGVYNADRTKKVYSKNGDVFYIDFTNNKKIQVTNTVDWESSAKFIQNGHKIAFRLNKNIYTWVIENGKIEQLTNFVTGFESTKSEVLSDPKERWLYEDQLRLSSVLAGKKEKRDAGKKLKEKEKLKRPLPIYLSGKRMMWADLSPDGNYVSYLLVRRNKTKRTDVPNYVTESGYTENINARSKVGQKPAKYSFFIYNRKLRKTTEVDLKTLEGYDYIPEFTQDYPDKKYENKDRISSINGPYWSSDGKNAFIEVRSNDHKDRWIALVNFEEASVRTLEHQHDEAWIAGPGIGWFSRVEMGWMPDNKRIWFKSEETGYAHLYVLNIKNEKKKALTKGKFEVYNPRISNDKKYWYFSSNQTYTGDRQLYWMSLDGGKSEQITNMMGNNDVRISPDEKYIAIRYSYSNKPWEVYLMKNPVVSGNEEEAKQITHSTTNDFKSYKWRDPHNITFKAEDGANVHARLYVPESNVKNNAAVIFVHGAGYLQNAHKWWSDYYREYMFHNILVDNGYTVLDIDYRASSGYGRDWRTSIYRHMGGKDLSDQVDGANYLIKGHGIDPEKVGIYGGSYGGFITLMAMFKAPETFKAGAAIRSVTDWSHYHHYYTSPILNTPVADSLAYVRSSPMYYAEGLEGHLLILHGMIDDNVQFQDVVRLSQRLIELGKKNWEMAIYPVERHGFTEPSSWTDEYTRIFNLFQKQLNKKE
ncbi:MAG: prolyl oligopeptidase family serine peptidase [Bacteroidota bacterium]